MCYASYVGNSTAGNNMGCGLRRFPRQSRASETFIPDVVRYRPSQAGSSSGSYRQSQTTLPMHRQTNPSSVRSSVYPLPQKLCSARQVNNMFYSTSPNYRSNPSPPGPSFRHSKSFHSLPNFRTNIPSRSGSFSNIHQNTDSHNIIVNLHYNTPTFDIYEMLPQICAGLGEPVTGELTRHNGRFGGQNAGIYGLTCRSKEYMLKVIPTTRRHSGVPTDTENLLKRLSEHRNIQQDKLLAFPKKIFRLMNSCNEATHDIHVMDLALGELLSVFLSASPCEKSLRVLGRLGWQLRRFHEAYDNKQHSDFHCSNIVYDEKSDQFTFIDCGGMGTPSTENDVQHFVKSLRLMHDSKLSSYGADEFCKGYYGS